MTDLIIKSFPYMFGAIFTLIALLTVSEFNWRDKFNKESKRADEAKAALIASRNLTDMYDKTADRARAELAAYKASHPPRRILKARIFR